MSDILINADLWSEKPEILSAEYGFDGIIGVIPFSEQGVKNAGGTWSTVTCSDGRTEVLTSASRVGMYSWYVITCHDTNFTAFPFIPCLHNLSHCMFYCR